MCGKRVMQPMPGYWFFIPAFSKAYFKIRCKFSPSKTIQSCFVIPTQGGIALANQ